MLKQLHIQRAQQLIETRYKVKHYVVLKEMEDFNTRVQTRGHSTYASGNVTTITIMYGPTNLVIHISWSANMTLIGETKRFHIKILFPNSKIRWYKYDLYLTWLV